jgi:hypothetical protein
VLLSFQPCLILYLAITQDMEKVSRDTLLIFVGFLQLSPASNPIILYILDAKIKRSINEFLGLHRFSFFNNAKKAINVAPIKKNDIRMQKIPQQNIQDMKTVPAKSLVKTVLVTEQLLSR